MINMTLMETRLPRRDRIFLLISAIWLDIIVVAFVVVQVNQVSTPIADWMHKIVRLLAQR
jgi:hypothetical protein